MQKINKDYSVLPAGLSGVNYSNKLMLSLAEKEAHKFLTSVYRHDTVLNELKRIYYGKCAFCESDTSAGAPMQVEHYRPKKAVTNAVPVHSGYYWLGYQWSNLLLSCSSCNNKKRNQFPVAGMRVFQPPMIGANLDIENCKATSIAMTAETPVLINPETDPNPMRHFNFYPDGKIAGITNEGLTTISLCGLNREPLIMKRKEFYDTYLDRFAIYFKDYEENNNEQTLLLQLKNAILEIFNHVAKNKYYREFAAKCLENFKSFYIDRFQAGQARTLILAYNSALDAA